MNLASFKRGLTNTMLTSENGQLAMRVVRGEDNRSKVFYLIVGNTMLVYPRTYDVNVEESFYNRLVVLAKDMNVGVTDIKTVTLIEDVTLYFCVTHFEKVFDDGNVASCHIDNPYLLEWLVGTRRSDGTPVEGRQYWSSQWSKDERTDRNP